jgi:hypothetical protein
MWSKKTKRRFMMIFKWFAFIGIKCERYRFFRLKMLEILELGESTIHWGITALAWESATNIIKYAFFLF